MEHPVPMLSDPRHRRLWDALDSAIPASKRRRSSDAQAVKAAEEALSMDPPDGSLTDDCKLVQTVYKVECPYKLSAGDILRRRK